MNPSTRQEATPADTLGTVKLIEAALPSLPPETLRAIIDIISKQHGNLLAFVEALPQEESRGRSLPAIRISPQSFQEYSSVMELIANDVTRIHQVILALLFERKNATDPINIVERSGYKSESLHIASCALIEVLKTKPVPWRVSDAKTKRPDDCIIVPYDLSTVQPPIDPNTIEGIRRAGKSFPSITVRPGILQMYDETIRPHLKNHDGKYPRDDSAMRKMICLLLDCVEGYTPQEMADRIGVQMFQIYTSLLQLQKKLFKGECSIQVLKPEKDTMQQKWKLV